MISVGSRVITTKHIIEYGEGIDILPGREGIVIGISTDRITHGPMFVVDFGNNVLVGCFPDEVSAVNSIQKDEWV